MASGVALTALVLVIIVIIVLIIAGIVYFVDRGAFDGFETQIISTNGATGSVSKVFDQVIVYQPSGTAPSTFALSITTNGANTQGGNFYIVNNSGISMTVTAGSGFTINNTGNNNLTIPPGKTALFHLTGTNTALAMGRTS